MRARHGAGAHRVHQDVHADPAPCRPFEGGDEAAGDLARVEDVGLEADSPLCAVDRFEHGRKDLVPVRQHVVAVRSAQIRADERGDVRRVPWVVGPGGAANLERLLVLREHQEDRDDARDYEENDEGAPKRPNTHAPELCNSHARSTRPSGPLDRRLRTGRPRSPGYLAGRGICRTRPALSQRRTRAFPTAFTAKDQAIS